ncbi:putative non-LTR retroelement reverse transcriptase, partial [Trifolium medium]|nr:putative non-LTR retroelement reverse transcriptase [Trifolium medium]
VYKVNFTKSSVMGVNVSTGFLTLAERCLHCSVGSIPFTYMGLPVGANPQKGSTWKPLLGRYPENLGFGGIDVGQSLETYCLASKEFLVGRASQYRKIAWGIWWDILLARYSALFPSPHLGGRPNDFTGKVGNGSATTFWFDPWLGGMPLKDRYHRLFQVSEQGVELVEDMGSWVHVVTQSPTLGVDDSWVWIHDPCGSYSLKSAYLAITGAVASLEAVSLLSRVWKSWAPSKVIVFSWQLLQDRVPTRQNLLKRRVIMEATGSFCALCGDFVELVHHHFTTCDSISPFWSGSRLEVQVRLDVNLACCCVVNLELLE